MAERLHRSLDDRMLAGVAGGVAETLDVDPSIVRIVWALLAILTGGVALIVYVVMAIVVPAGPDEPEPFRGPVAGGEPASSYAEASVTSGAIAPPPTPTRAEWRAARRADRRARRQGVDSGEAGLILGVVLIAIGALFLVRQVLPWFDFHLWWPIGLVVLGLLLLVVAVRPGRPTQ